MAKKHATGKLGNVDVIRVTTDSLNKKGKIKGKNKKEERVKRGACVHHKYNKKNKVKPDCDNEKGKCHCRMCDARFRHKPYSDDEVVKNLNPVKEMNNQLKFVAVATNAGPEAIRYASQLGAMLECFRKNYKAVISIAIKQDRVKKKGKKNKSNSGSAALGSWS